MNALPAYHLSDQGLDSISQRISFANRRSEKYPKSRHAIRGEPPIAHPLTSLLTET